jgi:hypothetical protein
MSLNFETPSQITPKKARTELQIRITNLAVPIRMHIYCFLNEKDIHCPEIYGSYRHGQNLGVRSCCLSSDLGWLVSKYRQNPYPYMIETAFSAMMGDCEVLQYLQGLPNHPLFVPVEKLSGQISDIEWFSYFLYKLIVGYNNIKTLRYARQMMFPWNQWALDVGIEHGVDMKILQWMHKQGCPYSDSTFGVAASWRNTDVLGCSASNAQ